MREIILVTGTKASGKSVATKKQIVDVKNRNTIIVDINYEQLYEEFEIIQPNKAVDFLMGNKGKIGRIVPFAKNERMTLDQIRKMIDKLLTTVNNGILVLESIGHYASPKLLEKIRVGNGKQKGSVSIVCIFQSITSIPNKLLNDADVVRLHKEMAHIDRYESVIEKFEILKLATLIVENKTKEDRYFNCSVNGWTTIEGSFDKTDYRNACVDYMITQQGLHRYSELF